MKTLMAKSFFCPPSVINIKFYTLINVLFFHVDHFICSKFLLKWTWTLFSAATFASYVIMCIIEAGLVSKVNNWIFLADFERKQRHQVVTDEIAALHLSLYLPLSSLPVSYGDTRTHTWLPHPPSLLVFCARWRLTGSKTLALCLFSYIYI